MGLWTRVVATAIFSVVAAGAAVGLGSCASAKGPAVPAPVTASRNIGASRTYSAAIAELGEYLAAWRNQGAAVASQEFLVPDQRVGGDGLILRGGRVISYEPYSWASDNQFRLLVTLDLHFTGSPGAWSEGHNDRFVTFSRSIGQGRYLMEFATGP